ETITKDSIKFSIGGKYTQVFEKQQYNIKINNGDLLGRQQLRLRSEVVDPSFLRSKLGYDLCNIFGLPSVQASYAWVYINDDNMGLYLLRDIYKTQWIESNFGIANTTTLYSCDSKYGDSYYFNCVNDDTEEVDDNFRDFIKKLEKSKNTTDLSKFFDVDLYIKWQAFKYLTGSWDHVTNMHNQYVFYNGKKWMNLLYDFDSDFGAYKSPNSAQSFASESLEMEFPLYKTLGLSNNHQTLVAYIKSMVFNGFNPVKLIPRIDELMEYLYPYVLEDRTPEKETTKRPGHIVRPEFKIENGFTIDDHLKNAEFHNYFLKKFENDKNYTVDEIYGLKRWIIERFRYVCSKYSMDCSFAKEYLEGGSYKLPSKDSTKVEMEQHLGGCKNSGYPCCLDSNAYVYLTDNTGDWSVEGNFWCLIVKDNEKTTTTTTTTTTTKNANPTSPAEDDCWSLERGYPCCVSATTVYYTSSNGKTWSVENGDWCGIRDTPTQTTTTTTTTTAAATKKPRPAGPGGRRNP
ncbi:Non-catalytic module family DOC2, partial [Piromyces sp. E2]